VFLEMGRYPMQIQWLQRTLSYWNKLVANKANRELIGFCSGCRSAPGAVRGS
jgi:hypothetical protein